MNSVREAAVVVPSGFLLGETSEQSGVRQVLSEGVREVRADGANYAVETDNSDVTVVADIHGAIEARQIIGIERGIDHPAERSIRVVDAAGQLYRPFSG